ncbi:MAG: FkbM family methyltransferase [Gomphosphaeria aponina SAG 52.96 = DSM 107014]|uniref:FkbM family methyltransferase n=1 Tax=Gomphosphaeria aponina SAG 52.96 = DSM 107014 TaxID=1521640 RepID=A0A941GVR1_9CHRO|nr:FkbM family methyltransferase [Gomphosphaeria aponina SAG 52.96 = DSM 107014]
MKYYHNLFNDRWVIEHIYEGMENGFFIEAGAMGGILVSSTYILEKDFKWNGICVEAIDEKYEKLKRNRNCFHDNRCLSNQSGLQVSFTLFNDKTGYSGITNTFNVPNKHMLEKEKHQTYNKETVSLQDLLIQHNAPNIIDYFGLDVEGHEPDILKAFPFSKPYTILAVSIEGHKCDHIMKGNGYLPVKNPYTENTNESYFIHQDIAKYRNVNLDKLNFL